MGVVDRNNPVHEELAIGLVVLPAGHLLRRGGHGCLESVQVTVMMAVLRLRAEEKRMMDVGDG